MKTTKEKIEVMQAFVDGKTIECQQAILPLSTWFEYVGSELNWNWEVFDYRIKPEPKLRPWKPEEVPVGALMKLKSNVDNLVYIITGKAHIHRKFKLWLGQPCKEDGMSIDIAFNDWVYSIDHGKTWHPCGVLE